MTDEAAKAAIIYPKMGLLSITLLNLPHAD